MSACGRKLLRSWPGSKQQEGTGIFSRAPSTDLKMTSNLPQSPTSYRV